MANQSTEAVESPQHKTLLLLLMFLFFWLAAAYFFLHLFGWLWAKVFLAQFPSGLGSNVTLGADRMER